MNKVRNMIYILIIFLLTIFLGIGTSYGFVENDMVRATKKCYVYEAKWSGGRNSVLEGYVRQKDSQGQYKTFPKGTIFDYVKKESKDGICIVKHTNGNHYLIKEVNLEKVEQKKSASDDFYQEYKGKTEADFLRYNEDQLKSLSDQCYLAIGATRDGTLKIQLGEILARIASAAKKKGMSVDDKNVIIHEIPVVSSTKSGEEEWKSRQQEVQENQKEIEGGRQSAEEGAQTESYIYQQPKRSSTDTGRRRFR